MLHLLRRVRRDGTQAQIAAVFGTEHHDGELMDALPMQILIGLFHRVDTFRAESKVVRRRQRLGIDAHRPVRATVVGKGLVDRELPPIVRKERVVLWK